MSYYGIDLGTTYSCLSKFEDGKATVIQNVAEQSNSLPSAVYFESETSIVVGGEAKNMVQTDAPNVVQFIKREIGKDYAPHEYFGQSFSAIDISAMILRKIKAYAEEQGEIVDKAVITCPAYFGLGERDATRKAGELAGLEVLDIVNEPTAAAISYAFRSGGAAEFPNETILVYDLGGGTFDVTILEISSQDVNGTTFPHFRVVATDGDDTLGGKDWDEILRGLLTEKVLMEAGLTEDSLDADDLAAIASKVEGTKKSLSAKQTATVRIPVQGETVKIEVGRDEFEGATAILVRKTLDCVARILTKEEVAGKKIDKILLVGGSSNMPMIPNAVRSAYPDLNVALEEPELAVAKGAACLASLIGQGFKDEPLPGGDNPLPDENGNPQPNPGSFKIVEDLTPRSFGLGVDSASRGWIVMNLVKKDTVIGEASHVQKTFGVPYDGCEKIIVPVYENVSQEDFVKPCTDINGEPIECDGADQCNELGRFELAIPEESRKERHPMNVDFKVDTTGVNVVVTDGVSGQVYPECHIVYNNANYNKEESKAKIDAFSIAD